MVLNSSKLLEAKITELDQMRAFSIAMAASITVIIASQLGLPVSSTHIAIGGVFGVGFLREYLDKISLKEVIQNDQEVLIDEQKNLKALISEKKKLENKKEKKKSDYRNIAKLYQAIELEIKEVKKAKNSLKLLKKYNMYKENPSKRL